MKKIIILLFVLCLNLNLNSVSAYTYTENDKNMFYDAFLEGYFTEMEKSVNQLNIEQIKKEKFMNELKLKTKKQDLINSSWSCIKKYPLEQIVSASVICTSDWASKQTEINKELFKLLR